MHMIDNIHQPYMLTAYGWQCTPILYAQYGWQYTPTWYAHSIWLTVHTNLICSMHMVNSTHQSYSQCIWLTVHHLTYILNMVDRTHQPYMLNAYGWQYTPILYAQYGWQYTPILYVQYGWQYTPTWYAHCIWLTVHTNLILPYIDQMGDTHISHLVNKCRNIKLIWTKNNQYPIYWFASMYSNIHGRGLMHLTDNPPWTTFSQNRKSN